MRLSRFLEQAARGEGLYQDGQDWGVDDYFLADNLDAEAFGNFRRRAESEKQDIGAEQDGKGEKDEGEFFGEGAFAEYGNAVNEDGAEEGAERPHDEMIVGSEMQIPGSEGDSHEGETGDDSEKCAGGGKDLSGTRVAKKLGEGDEKNREADADDGERRSKEDHGESVGGAGGSARGAEVAEKIGEEGVAVSGVVGVRAAGIEEHGEGSHQEEEDAGGCGETENAAVKK